MGTVADKLSYLNDTKSMIKKAIEDKGVTVPDGTTFRRYATLIGDISGGNQDGNFSVTTTAGRCVPSEVNMTIIDLASISNTPTAVGELKE